jgi:hypothetical protein
MRAKLNNTKIGKFNLRCHILWENIRNKWAPRLILLGMSDFRLTQVGYGIVAVKKS